MKQFIIQHRSGNLYLSSRNVWNERVHEAYHFQSRSAALEIATLNQVNFLGARVLAVYQETGVVVYEAENVPAHPDYASHVAGGR